MLSFASLPTPAFKDGVGLPDSDAMDVNAFAGNKRSKVSELIRHFEEAHKEEIDTITQVLVKITSRTPEEIKPFLDVMLSCLVEPIGRPFYETATPEEWSLAFREWVDSHRDFNLPNLSDEAISRESIYGDRG